MRSRGRRRRAAAARGRGRCWCGRARGSSTPPRPSTRAALDGIVDTARRARGSTRPWCSPRSTSRRCPPRCCCGWPGSAGSPARRSTTRARCSTCGCAPATGPVTTCPRTSPSPSGRWRSPPPPGYRLPPGDDGRLAVLPPAAAWATCSGRCTAAPTSCCTPAPPCRPGAGPPSTTGAPRSCSTGDGLRRRRHRRARTSAELTATVAPAARGRSTSAAAPTSPELAGVLAGADARRRRQHRRRAPGRRRRHARGVAVRPGRAGRAVAALPRPAGAARRPGRRRAATPAPATARCPGHPCLTRVDARGRRRPPCTGCVPGPRPRPRDADPHDRKDPRDRTPSLLPRPPRPPPRGRSAPSSSPARRPVSAGPSPHAVAAAGGRPLLARPRPRRPGPDARGRAVDRRRPRRHRGSEDAIARARSTAPAASTRSSPRRAPTAAAPWPTCRPPSGSGSSRSTCSAPPR